jgi:hypothetical protein
MLVNLLKDDRFLPLVNDFTSFTKYCLANKRTLLLKTFLQSFKIQFIFRSFTYENQKQIVKQLMTGAKGGVFEPAITLKKPYSICGMGVLLENYKTMGQAQTVCKELLTTLTKE